MNTLLFPILATLGGVLPARRTDLTEPTLDAGARVGDLMRQIAPYYDPKALEE